MYSEMEESEIIFWVGFATSIFSINAYFFGGLIAWIAFFIPGIILANPLSTHLKDRKRVKFYNGRKSCHTLFRGIRFHNISILGKTSIFRYPPAKHCLRTETQYRSKDGEKNPVNVKHKTVYT